MNETKAMAVIMTVHNRRDTTLECIRRFYTCRGVEAYEVDFYLMDDGCTDGTYAYESFAERASNMDRISRALLRSCSR